MIVCKEGIKQYVIWYLVVDKFMEIVSGGDGNEWFVWRMGEIFYFVQGNNFNLDEIKKILGEGMLDRIRVVQKL